MKMLSSPIDFRGIRLTGRALVLSCLFCLAFSPTSRASVVFGNLGASGDAALGSTSSDISETDPYLAAIGFTTGSSGNVPLKLLSITLGLWHDNSLSQDFTLKIYTDDDGTPSDTVAFTSLATSVGDKDLYTFSFDTAQLSAGTAYWVRPDTGLSWYVPASNPNPVEHNSSGYIWTGGTGLASTDGGLTWGTQQLQVSEGHYSISVNAIPEPSATMFLGIGLAGMVALSMRRRRLSSATAGE